jgi:DNA-binding CsgD family transcriptional regulator
MFQLDSGKIKHDGAAFHAICMMINNSAEFLAAINTASSVLVKENILLRLKTGNIYEMSVRPYYAKGINAGHIISFRDLTDQMYSKQLLDEKNRLIEEQNELLIAAYRRLEDQAAELEMQNADMIQAQSELREWLQSQWQEISSKLGQREQQVLAMVGQHRNDKEIADILFVSPRTVETHRTNIKRKLGISSHAELMAAADIANKCFFAA